MDNTLADTDTSPTTKWNHETRICFLSTAPTCVSHARLELWIVRAGFVPSTGLGPELFDLKHKVSGVSLVKSMMLCGMRGSSPPLPSVRTDSCPKPTNY